MVDRASESVRDWLEGEGGGVTPAIRDSICEHAVRWATNILVEVQGNHSRVLRPWRRDALRRAIEELGVFQGPEPIGKGAVAQPGRQLKIRRVLERWDLVRDGGIGQLAEAIDEELG